MGKGSTPGPSQQVTSGETADQSALAALVGQQTQQSNTLFNLTEPGLVQSENFYESLASGDPGAIMRATAPTAQASAGLTVTTPARGLVPGAKVLAPEPLAGCPARLTTVVTARLGTRCHPVKHP